MKKFVALWIFINALCLSGCATQTSYQPQGFTGGFSEKQISETFYQVKFSGNGLTSSDKVWYYWIYRCAELTKSKGYTAFVLISDKTPAPKTSQTDDLSPSIKPAFAQSGDEPSYASIKGGSGGYYYVPSYGGGTVTTYSASAIVRFLKEPFPDDISYFQAQAVLDLLKPYIDSEGTAKVPARADVLKQALVIGKTVMATRELPNSAAGSTLDDYKNLIPGEK